MRQYGEVPPWKAPLNTPTVFQAVGLGNGGGASVYTADSSGFGEIDVFVGPGALSSWRVTIMFPTAPPNMFCSGDDAFGPLQYSFSGTNLNYLDITGPSANFKPAGYGSKPLKLHYEWRVSQ